MEVGRQSLVVVGVHFAYIGVLRPKNVQYSFSGCLDCLYEIVDFTNFFSEIFIRFHNTSYAFVA